MAGYTRNDTLNNIADGNVISAADLDGEFDAIDAAFDEATGHVHDGTANNGAPITKIGPAQDLVVSTGAVTPKTDNAVDLGTSSFEFKDLYIDGVANIDSLVADTADINAGTIDGVTLGTNSAVTQAQIDNININGNAIITTNTDGNLALTPNGTGEVDISKVDIDSGTIDGTVIGGASAAAGTFTNLTANGTVNFTGATVSNGGTFTTIDINGGSIDGVTIGTNSAVTDMRVDNLQLNGNTISSTDTNGNIAITPNGIGEVDISKVDIDSGTIDGTAIGGATAAAGSFTTLGASSTATLNTLSSSGATLTGGTINGIAIGGSTPAAGSFTTLNTSGQVVFNDAGANVDFRVEGDTDANLLFVDASADQVGIGTSSPSGKLHVAVTAAGDTSLSLQRIGSSRFEFQQGIVGVTGDALFLKDITSSRDYLALRDGNVGIGTNAPTTKAQITKAALTGFVSRTQSTLTLESSTDTELYFASGNTSSGQLRFGDDGGNFRGAISYDHSADAFLFYTAGSERMRIASSGNVGIGTTAMNYRFNVRGAGTVGDSSVFMQLTTLDTGTSNTDGGVIGLGVGASPIMFVTNYENAALAFSTNNTERARITSDGFLRMASGTGGIQFNGDTAAANALDDYEEGTWTPTVIGTTTAGTASYTAQVGNYTKIGRVVYIQFTIEYNSGTGTGDLRISGLPFTVGASANSYPLSIQAGALTLTANHYVQAILVSTITEVAIQSVAVGTNPSIGAVSYDAAAFLRGAGFYFI